MASTYGATTMASDKVSVSSNSGAVFTIHGKSVRTRGEGNEVRVRCDVMSLSRPNYKAKPKAEKHGHTLICWPVCWSMTTLKSVLQTVTQFWLVTRSSKLISDNKICTNGSHWAVSSPHLWLINKANETTPIALVSSEIIRDTEHCPPPTLPARLSSHP
jgi:hypothetical protein